MTAHAFKSNPKLDLVLERTVDIAPEKIWSAWTNPEHLKVWFCPAPWKAVACEIDLRPGGIFSTTMQSPEGQQFPNVGCFLEIVPNKKLVFTDGLITSYRPSGNSFMTAMILLEPAGSGTKYTAIAMHANEESRKKHEEMGFLQGWGKTLEQLVAHMKTQK